MWIHEYEGLIPGKCGKRRTFDTCLPSRFNMLKQNAGLRTSTMFPVTGSDGTVTPKKMKENVLTHFSYANLTLPDKIKGCTYEGLKFYITNGIPGEEKEPPAGWKWAPTNKIYSFQSVLFDELVHVALNDAGLDRWGDEATVEDITLQIFPREPINEGNAHGDNVYEMKYDKALVDGGFQLNSILSFLKRLAFELFPFLFKDEYYYNRIHRKFNPREKFNGIDLKYEESDNIGVIEYLGRKKRENINWNDAIHKPLIEYIIPYVKCCGRVCNPPPPEDDNRIPGNDHGDELFSYSDGVVKEYNLAPEAVIYLNGYYKEAFKVFGGLLFDGNNTAQELIKITPFLVIPSGGLFGKENDLIFKEFLKEYVRLGGTLVVFAQQYNFSWDILPTPPGDRISGPGWRQDQSCYHGSSYYTKIHPVTSSWITWENTGAMGTDGYFIDYPSNSTVILRRTKNRYPLMLYYPYTNEEGTETGGVIVCSLFTDWAAAHGQSTLLERRLVRDLITFAKNPHKEIPLYSFTDSNSIEVNLEEVNIKNNSEVQAAKVKLIAFTPERNKVLYETEQSISMEPSQETIISLAFGLNSSGFLRGYGICNLDYILYDNENNMVQMNTESDGGRFAVYQKEQVHTPTRDFDIWITSSREQYYVNEKAQITIYVKSYKEEPLTIYWWHQWGHTGGE